MIPLLVEASVRALLVACAVAAVLRALHIASARARHSAWCGVLGAMLLLPVVCAWGPQVSLPILPRRADSIASMTEIPGDRIAQPVATSFEHTRTDTAPLPSHARFPLWWMAYLAVASLLLLRLGSGAVRLGSILKRARVEEGFYSSPDCASPITIGWWKPVIVLPVTWMEWPEPELDAVLKHERDHVTHRDPVVQMLAALNCCLFWFHPLAWWLEHRLAGLAEDACDAAVVASGHDPKEYAEYLIRQARAVERSGARIALSFGGGTLSHRIRRLSDEPPAATLSRSRAIVGTALCALVIVAFAACQLDHTERPAAGQPSMHELAMRRAHEDHRLQDRERLILNRAHSLTAEEAQQLLAKLKQSPQDSDAYGTLVRYFEFHVAVKDLDAFKLWYIEHQPAGKVSGGNIDPHIDRAGYEKGKALWLANLKPNASPLQYRRAAEFLEGADKPLAQSILLAGRKAFPDDRGWPAAFGRHYAQVLLGSAEPLTEYNVIRRFSSEEAQGAYAQAVRTQLAQSSDARVLAETARWLLLWGNPAGPVEKETRIAVLQLIRTLAGRALSIDPQLSGARSAREYVDQIENSFRFEELKKMPAPKLAAVSAGDRIIIGLSEMREAAIRQNFGAAESQARELLNLAAQNRNNALYGEAIFEANIVMGKAALRRRGDHKAAARDLLAASETPGSGEIYRGDFEMNLQRALVDAGERRAVIDFFQRMAPKTRRARQFNRWAADLSRGLNPDLIPTFSATGCSNDPC